MKRIKWRMVTFAFIIGACSSRDSGNGIHESLIGFKSSTIMTMDDLVEAGDDTYKKLSSSKFNPETDTIRFSKNEIYISYLAIVNGCAKYQGDIDVRDDSIILKLKNINEVSCTEERCDRLIFKIKNAGNKKYIIGKGKIS